MGETHWRNGLQFSAPATPEEAAKRAADLGGDIEMIQSQLAERNRLVASGEGLHDADYWIWRKKATAALVFKKEELRRVRQWLRENPPAPLTRKPSQPMILVLRALRAVLIRLKGEEELVAEIEAYLTPDGTEEVE